MKNLHVLLFDLDGVLLDSESNLEWLDKALIKTLHQINLPDTEENVMKIHSQNIKNFPMICKEFNKNPEEFWKIRNNNYIEEKNKAMRDRSIKAFDDVKDLYQLKGKYVMDILSNSPQEVVDLFVSLNKFDDLFEELIGRGRSFHDLLRIKPHPYLFEQFMKKRSYLKSGSVIYVGDQESDRRFAEETCMKFYYLLRDQNEKNSFSSITQIVNHLLSKK
jgi:phosphoglycolate phosphatase